MIGWAVAERQMLHELNAQSLERTFTPHDVDWEAETTDDEARALYDQWSLLRGTRFDAQLDDVRRARFARYQHANLMLFTALFERYALLLEGLFRLDDDLEFTEYVGHFIKEETYHYVVFMRAIDRIQADMPGAPRLPRLRIQIALSLVFFFLALVPFQKLRVSLAFTVFHFAEQVSMIAHKAAREVVDNRGSFIPSVWAFHAIDEGRHLRFDALLLKKFRPPRPLDLLRRALAIPLCVFASFMLHTNELWAARELGVNVRLWHLPRLIRGAEAPFKRRVFKLIQSLRAPLQAPPNEEPNG